MCRRFAEFCACAALGTAVTSIVMVTWPRPATRVRMCIRHPGMAGFRGPWLSQVTRENNQLLGARPSGAQQLSDNAVYLRLLQAWKGPAVPALAPCSWSLRHLGLSLSLMWVTSGMTAQSMQTGWRVCAQRMAREQLPLMQLPLMQLPAQQQLLRPLQTPPASSTACALMAT